jgi:hypothetical protein
MSALPHLADILSVSIGIPQADGALVVAVATPSKKGDPPL